MKISGGWLGGWLRCVLNFSPAGRKGWRDRWKRKSSNADPILGAVSLPDHRCIELAPVAAASASCLGGYALHISQPPGRELGVIGTFLAGYTHAWRE